jgi:hypothetical protein
MLQIATVMNVFCSVGNTDPHPDLDPYVYGPPGSASGFVSHNTSTDADAVQMQSQSIVPLGDSTARLLRLLIANWQLVTFYLQFYLFLSTVR